ncbi:MAG: phosphoribosylformylglycinamidine synthase subunit PurL [Candidatus Bathyarchaeota archaeon]|nr:phosphoribosylformylglycinamidine synthase subunit PurL [Candidatus Bathyarchaeum tardum]WGM89565.1 MAG: phosphoribosylformylglycinamidine synthase subunit PurL [Candidatus Bathyarchaeum tardum]WNZ30331.1 MAG: phosphoribosylformylglycinamidine synthase subunit PurL [Candidatus Bathyarchaeota archaeon]
MSRYVKKDVPFELVEINLQDADDQELLQISAKMGIGLNLNEMKIVKNYFAQKNRNPTDVELQTIGQTWSEHCYHKTFKGDITTPEGKISSLFKTYIAKATKELNPSWCISVFEDNAGIIDFDKNYAIAAKVETHNHPSAIEPFGGAATGTGGVIRDILAVWADPIACTDVLCFGPLDYDYNKLPAGTKHPKYVYSGVVAGIGTYGNNMGIPTVNGAINFDESYVGNVVVYCGCIGILPKDKFVKDTRAGDIALLVGGETGRDGIHGVTFASAELTKESEEISRPAVQIANPIEEERVKRAIVKLRDAGLGSAITDIGGGGISCGTGEMAERSNLGIHVFLEKIPLKYQGLAPWEIYVSESQERMLLSVPEKNLEKALEIFENENVTAAPIGKFTTDGMLKVTYHGQIVADLDIDFIFVPPKFVASTDWQPPKLEEPILSEPTDLNKELLDLLSLPNIASKESVIRTYDHEVKGNTVLKPLQSKYGGPNDAAVLKPLVDSWMGVVVSSGLNTNYGKIDPYWMAASCIDEAIRNNVAVGGRRIALLDNFTWGNPQKPDRLGSLVSACKACYDFAKGFEAPFISGKDSLYNESPMGPVTPTLLITAIGIIPDIRKTVSMELKQPGNSVYLVGKTYAELGGSHYYQNKGVLGNSVPQVRLEQAKKTMNKITEAIDNGYLRACHDLSEGGLAVASAEMAFSSGFGLDLDLGKVSRTKNVCRNDFALFSESNSRFLVEVTPKYKDCFEKMMKDVDCAEIGSVTKDAVLSVTGLDGKLALSSSIDELRRRWKSVLGS